MPLFPVSNDLVQLSTAAIAGTDTFQNGVLVSNLGLVRAVDAGGDEYTNGLLMTDSGRVRYIDATAGLPAGSTVSNGLFRDTNGALCVSTGALSTYSNGLPMVTNGALRVSITA
jgi:hypothetical protein